MLSITGCHFKSHPVTLFLMLVLICMLHIPQSAMAGYSTSLSIYAIDNYAPTEEFSETIEDVFFASASVGFDERPGSYGSTMSATASASFDLGTGEVKFYIDSMGRYASSSASVDISDTIYPVWEFGYDGIMDVEISWTISGDYDVYSWNPTTEEWVPGGGPLNLGLSSTFYYRVDEGSYIQTPTPWNQYNLADGYEAWTQTVAFDPEVNTSIDIGQRAWIWLETFNGQLAVADFSNTGLIEVTLPEGASYTSDSGVFLTGPSGGSVIPAPSAILLGSIGVGFVSWLRKRKAL